LLTTPSGEKFGKSAGNAVFIDQKLTKPYDLYQYFIRAPDSVVESYLCMFTLIPLAEISKIMIEHSQAPERRIAQRVLANDITDIIHGLGAGRRAALISQVVFPSAGEDSTEASSSEIIAAFRDEGLLKEYPREEVIGQQWRAVLSMITGKSKSECARTIKAGGVYCGLERKKVSDTVVGEDSVSDNQLLLIRIGKANYHTILLN
jgi:tyrosyl-tRNA synthetase